MLREDRSELRVGHHGCMPDPVDCLEAVVHPDGVEPAPSVARPHPRIDLEMQVTMRVTGPRGEVPDHCSLDLLDRHLDLPPPRPDPSRGVFRQSNR